jgi:parallel beta-helix repeat protein
MKKAMVLMLIFWMLISSFAFFSFPLQVDSYGFDGWTYRKSHRILQSASAGTDYQVMIVVRSGTGTDEGHAVYTSDKTRSDFGDVRFIGEDGTTQLSYWIEEVNPGVSATFWVKIPYNLSETDRTIYVKYGNPTASSVSDGAGTFVFYDDFNDLNQWSIRDGAWVIENGSATCESNEGNLGTQLEHGDSAILYRAKLSRAQDYCRAIVGYRLDYALSRGYRSYWGYHGGLGGKVIAIDAALWSAIAYGTKAWEVNNWFVAEARFAGSLHEFEFNHDGLPISAVESSSLSGSVVLVQTSDYSPKSVWYDWLAIRKCVKPEPSHGIWGEEEWFGGTIYIRADGSIDPSGAPIRRNGDTYALIGNITSDGDGIIVQKNDVTVDGAGYTVQGTGSGTGVGLTERSNVTMRNMEIRAFNYGVHLHSSNYNTISVNNITANGDFGVLLYLSSSNTISVNNIIANNETGISLPSSSYNSISRNNIAANPNYGVFLHSSNYNSISGNNITASWAGVFLGSSSAGNSIFHNNFADNRVHAYTDGGSPSMWDDGYPSGGNYWSGYSGVDLLSGPYQNETGSDGIGDWSYVIDGNNRDNYPVMNAILPLQGDVNEDHTVDIFDCVIVALAFGSSSSDPMPPWNPIADINNDGIVDIFDIVVVALHFGETG